MEPPPEISEARNPAVKFHDWTDRVRQSVTNAFSRLHERTAKDFQHLKKKGLNYWLWVALLVPVSMLAGDYLTKHRMLIAPRYWVYYQLQRITPRAPTYFQHTLVVSIGDEEYWRSPKLARRTPLKKDYLVDLIDRLVAAKAPVIAIDVDLRAQTPDRSPLYDKDYEGETIRLLNKISDVSNTTHIILPRTTIAANETAGPLAADDHYLTERTVYDEFSLNTAKVHEGFVSLPYDIRQVPILLPVENLPTPLFSFAAAAVQTQDPEWLLNARANDPLPYGIFLSPDSRKSLSAAEVLATPAQSLESRVANKIVLIGGTWHQDSYGHGNVVDTHYTPVGEIPGVFVHANYMEALMTHWSSPALGQTATTAIEFSLTVFIALMFAWQMGRFKRFLCTACIPIFLILVTCFLWQNLGIFFDFFIPLTLLGAHAVVDKILEWRRHSAKYVGLLAAMKEQGKPLPAAAAE
jgi:CHASE2 domain-containing sensor protein